MTPEQLQHLAEQCPITDQYDGFVSGQDAYIIAFKKAIQLISYQGDALVINGQLPDEATLMELLVV